MYSNHVTSLGAAITRPFCHFSFTVVVLWASALVAAEDGTYRQFLSLVDTNNPRPQAIKSPLLVDANNTALKATGVVTNLAKVRHEDSIAGVRLGMTIGQVMTVWGKPTWIWSACVDRLPSFTYGDVMLGFEENSLKVIRFFTHHMASLDHLDGGLGVSSPINDWARVLGEPALRNEYSLTYAGAKSTMTLRFHDAELIEVRIERSKAVAKPEQSK